MNKFWTVVKHTYLSKVKAKSFIIMTTIMILLIVALGNISSIISLFDDDHQNIGVIAPEQIYKQLEQNSETNNSDITLKSFDNEEAAEKSIKDKDIESYLIIDVENDLPSGVYKTLSISDQGVIDKLQNTLQQVKVFESAQHMEVSQDQLTQLFSPVKFEKVAIAIDEKSGAIKLDSAAKTEDELNQTRGLVYVMLMFIGMSVMIYASMIATEVATEKSSRVMEILISSVPPTQQMFGKIVGVALLSFTQMAIIITAGVFSFKGGSGSESISGFFSFDKVSVKTIVFGIIFLLLGYFLFATLAALLGSLVSRVEDVQNTVLPMTMLALIGFYIAIFGLGSPGANFITISSFFPFFTPMIMFLRVGMLDIPIWQPLIGIVILIASIILMATFGARVYKGGVLMYGKSSPIKGILKALQLSKKE